MNINCSTNLCREFLSRTIKSRVPVRYVAHLHLLCIVSNYYADLGRKCRSILVDGSAEKRKKPNEKKRIPRREHEGERWCEGCVELGHVTGRRGAKRRTRRRPPPGASPAAPCLSLPVSIFLFSYSSASLSSFSLRPLAPSPSTLPSPSAR